MDDDLIALLWLVVAIQSVFITVLIILLVVLWPRPRPIKVVPAARDINGRRIQERIWKQ